MVNASIETLHAASSSAGLLRRLTRRSKSVSYVAMNNDATTDGLAAVGSLVLLLPVSLFITAMTGSTLLGYGVGALMLVNAIRLMYRSGGGD